MSLGLLGQECIYIYISVKRDKAINEWKVF